MLSPALRQVRANSGITFRSTDQHWEDTGINTNEEVVSGETEIDCDADASSAIPAGSIIKINSELMSVTATGSTITVTRTDLVTHSTNADIYKLVKSCVLWLPGQDDAYSSTIRDRSGLGNHGTIYGASWVRLASGLWALEFEGGDDYVSIGATKFDDFDDVSIEMWVRPAANAGNAITFSHQAAGNDRSIFYIGGGNTALRWYFITVGGGVICNIGSDDNFTAGVWRHIVGILGNSGAMMYVNGIKQASTDASTECWNDMAASNLNDFGGEATAENYSGLIVLPRIYNRELPLLIANGHYNQERHLFGV